MILLKDVVYFCAMLTTAKNAVGISMDRTMCLVKR